jgi:hypothetical protein
MRSQPWLMSLRPSGATFFDGSTKTLRHCASGVQRAVIDSHRPRLEILCRS